MNKFTKSIILGLGLYFLVSLPHFIYMYTGGQYGIEYEDDFTEEELEDIRTKFNEGIN